MAKTKPQILFFDSYLAFIKNSAGSQMFRSIYADVDGERKDILESGTLACAYFVSSALKLFGLVESLHATVLGLRRDLQRSGWYEVGAEKVLPGCIVYWKPRKYEDGETHAHVGFYLGKGEAVSADAVKKEIVSHLLDELNGPREVEVFLWHKRLESR